MTAQAVCQDDDRAGARDPIANPGAVGCGSEAVNLHDG